MCCHLLELLCIDNKNELLCYFAGDDINDDGHDENS